MKTIFITYNPKSEQEKTLAMRLHSIGAVNGFRMYLPDRYNSDSVLDDETKARISKSDYLVMFSTNPLSTIVRQEIEFAFRYLQDKSKILVIYDKHQGKNLTGKITEYFTPFYFDKFENKQEELLRSIISTISHIEKNEIIKKQKSEIQRLERQRNDSNALAAFLGIGLGLLILGTAND